MEVLEEIKDQMTELNNQLESHEDSKLPHTIHGKNMSRLLLRAAIAAGSTSQRS
jgi:hypothetical protein